MRLLGRAGLRLTDFLRREGGAIEGKPAAMADESTPEEAPSPEQKPDDDGQQNASESQQPDVPPEVKRALRQANKEAETLRLKLKEFEDRDKTETQKLAERADAAEKRALDLESRALRLEVASEKGLTSAQAKRLVGSTRDELEADADELLETFKTTDAPVPSLDLGQRTGVDTKQNFNTVLRRAAGRT